MIAHLALGEKVRHKILVLSLVASTSGFALSARVKPHPDFIPGSPIYSSQINENFNELYDALANFGGDVSGNSNEITVQAIRGVPVSATPPTSGDVLSFDGTQWLPASSGGGGLGLGGGTLTGNLTVNADLAVTGNVYSPGTDPDSLKLGVSASASSADAVAIGNRSAANGMSTAIGNDSSALNTSSVALGYSSNAAALNSVSIGADSDATGADSIAIGSNTDALSSNSISIGANTSITGANAIAIGGVTSVAATRSIAIGPNITTAAGATDSIAIGYSAGNTSPNSVSIGNDADTGAADSIAIGKAAETDNLDSVAVGAFSSVRADASVAIGKSTLVTAGSDYSTVVGTSAKSYALPGTAIGFGATVSVSATDSIALGMNANALSANALVIGSSTSQINKIYVGKGEAAGTATAVTLQPSGGNGVTGGHLTVSGGMADAFNQGGDLTLSGGKGNSGVSSIGTNYGGSINFVTQDDGGTLISRMTVTNGGASGSEVPTVKIDGTLKLRSYSSQPFACSIPEYGTIALNSNHEACICRDYSGASWRLLTSPATPCTW